MTLEPRILPEARRGALLRALEERGFLRLVEAHNGLSALIAEQAYVQANGERVEYDGIWGSGLTDSAARGLPDVELLGPEDRLRTLREIVRVTEKPIVVDGDTGGPIPQFEYFVRDLERLGVSAVVIEDKAFPKRNSLDPSARQTLSDPKEFAQKIRKGKEACVSDDFLIVARLESLITGLGLEDALKRAERYVEADVDGIMIHSKKERPDDILAFAHAYEDLCQHVSRRPFLVCVPTTYNLISDRELAEHGFNVIIHANHLLRSAHRAMDRVARTILTYDRSFEAEPFCSPVADLFALVGFDRVKAQDRELSLLQRLAVVIPAAGRDPIFPDLPKPLISVAGRPLLTHQLEAIRQAGLNRVVVVRGKESERLEEAFEEEHLTFCENPAQETTHSLRSLLAAEAHMKDGFFLVYSDILFEPQHLTRLLQAGKDIVLLVDSSYRYHKHEVDKKLDLVAGSEPGRPPARRRLHPGGIRELAAIGKEVDPSRADYEFVGIAYFSPEGARILRQVYRDCSRIVDGFFHEAPSFAMAGVTDLLQEIMDRGFTVHGLEVFKGWIEIHSPEDIQLAEREILGAPMAWTTLNDRRD